MQERRVQVVQKCKKWSNNKKWTKYEFNQKWRKWCTWGESKRKKLFGLKEKDQERCGKQLPIWNCKAKWANGFLQLLWVEQSSKLEFHQAFCRWHVPSVAVSVGSLLVWLHLQYQYYAAAWRHFQLCMQKYSFHSQSSSLEKPGALSTKGSRFIAKIRQLMVKFSPSTAGPNKGNLIFRSHFNQQN